jgi:PAS domain S-box-containing protein
MVRTDGVVRRMRSTGRAVRDDSGSIIGMIGVMQDITHRYDIERELAVSQQRRDALLESIPAPAWLKDRAGRFIAVNRAWYRRFNKDPGFAIGRTNEEVFPGPFAAEREREDRIVFETRKEVRVERKVRVDGDEGWFETVKMPVFDHRGEVSGIVGISFDTTARKRAEEQLRASEERFRQFADSMQDVFWIHELEPGKADYVNHAFEEIWGLEPSALVHNFAVWLDSVDVADRERIQSKFDAWVDEDAREEFHAEYRIVRADGQVRWIRHYGTKLRDAGGKTFRLQSIAEDVTDRYTIEMALAESQRRRNALLESNPDPAWLKDLQGRYIAVNRAWFTRRGLEPYNIEGKTDRDFFSPDRAAIIDAEDRRVIEAKMVVRSERNWSYSDGAAWIETVKSPVLDADGHVTAIVGLSHDITERKRSEQAVQRMNETLAQQTAELTALNRELEAFAYTVSHDLRAPLRHIDGFVNLLKSHAGKTFDAQSTRYYERISNAARRMGQLIDDLLAFSRTGRAELRVQDVALDRLVRETIELLKPDTAARRIEWKIGALPEVRGDAGLLAIVLQNLVSNAIKYSRPRDIAHIEIRAVRDGNMTTLSVRDNGVGFDMQYGHKLFGVFQRLHLETEFEGTGIGLATVARIVQRHHGRVWAESTPGEGSVFYVSLPLATGEAKVA